MDLSRRKFMLAGGASVLAAPGLAGLALGGEHRLGVEIVAREDSLWAAEAPKIPTLRRFEGERRVDLAIVGGGYTGLSCAYYAKLFRPDWNVIVLESNGIGSGASSRNSGAVHAKHVGISDTEMPQRGLDRLRRFIDTEQIDCDFMPASTLMLLSSKRSADAARDDLEPGAKFVSAGELRERIGSGYYPGAVDTPRFFSVQPAKLVAGHARAALRVGAELFENSPVLSVKRGQPAEISTPEGRVLADNVFIATNAHTPRLGFFQSSMYPLHQYSLATRKLTRQEVSEFGLDQWTLRFEQRLLPVTFGLSPSGHFFLRMVLGYASFNSCVWKDLAGARSLAARIFRQRYPSIEDVEMTHGWHGVTGHTALFQQIAGRIGHGNIHVSAAYNGLGIMPGHNNGYLTACEITGHADEDTRFLTGVSGQIPVPGDFYRSLLLKPMMKLMTPV